MKFRVTRRIILKVSETELQMLYEAVKHAEPFADLSPELRTIEKKLEKTLGEACGIAKGSLTHGIQG